MALPDSLVATNPSSMLHTGILTKMGGSQVRSRAGRWAAREKLRAWLQTVLVKNSNFFN
jgi:hypothetical protein